MAEERGEEEDRKMRRSKGKEEMEEGHRIRKRNEWR